MFNQTLTSHGPFQATIVTADGSVVIANETKNPDLFFGIRGGGCNFGVATEFVLKLHPQRRTVYAGSLVFEGSALQKLVQYTQAWWPKAGQDEGMLQMFTAGPDGTVNSFHMGLLTFTNLKLSACNHAKHIFQWFSN